MKKIILILACCIPIYCFPQNWAEDNAVWYYDQSDFVTPPNTDYFKFSKIGDTIINGDSAKILKEEYFAFNYTSSDKIYMKSDSNRVYLFVPPTNSFELIYNFDAVPGDTIHVYCGFEFFLQNSSIDIVIDSVSFMDINGNLMKVQHVSQHYTENDEFSMNGDIIENIGWTGFMFPLHSWADPPTGGKLRCFQNDRIGLFKISNVDCDYINAVESKSNHELIKILPNPTKGKIKIQANNIKKIEITGINGKFVYSGKENEIDLANHKKGIYIITVVTEEKTETDKIVLK